MSDKADPLATIFKKWFEDNLIGLETYEEYEELAAEARRYFAEFLEARMYHGETEVLTIKAANHALRDAVRALLQ